MDLRILNVGTLLLFILFTGAIICYDVKVSENEPTRINIVSPSAGFTGGGVTIWYLAACLIKAGFQVRYFMQNSATGRPANSTILRYESLSDELHNIGSILEFDSGERPVPCNPHDLWMATWCKSWDAVFAAQSQLKNFRPLYLIQDDERWLNKEQATRSYSFDHYTIFNGPPLKDWVSFHKLGVFSKGIKHGEGHSYTATAALAARVPVTAALLAARRKPYNGKKRLAVYYRSHAERNKPSMILEVLSQLLFRRVVSIQKWNIVGVSDHGPIAICTLANGTACLQIPAMLAPKEYDDFLGSCDVAISLCTSGGASWPVIDFATHGAVVVTNAVSRAHKQFFESMASTVLTTSNVTVAALLALVEKAFVISNSLTLEQRAAAANEASTHFPTSFCADECFGKTFTEKLRAWMNGIVLKTAKMQFQVDAYTQFKIVSSCFNYGNQGWS
ncbi:unnamed protein product [Rotaria magnacalcarata]|uniref:WsaF C-terminal domain-containing protein n=2 Tax=Rotaria TaxID=231623 RepID=A0A819ZUV2_9BILA|nr:unnamed protein product [Rotaria magnacalcarata]